MEIQIYSAAIYTNGYRAGGNSGRYAKLNLVEKESVDKLVNILESYHYIHKRRFVDAIREDGVQVFLDSGAFSAFTLGVQIDISAYCRYIHEYQDIIRKDGSQLLASVLDGIGSAEQTLANQQEMERQGVRPLPCFHFGEGEEYLEHYVRNYDYITIGGMVGKPVHQLTRWLDRAWNRYILDGTGKPRLKVHAFGITSVEVMERYPWQSCDSSSWVQAASYGSIVIPGLSDEKLLTSIDVSEKSPKKHVAGQHITTLSSIEKSKLIYYLTESGYDLERLSTVYESRAAFNLRAYYELNRILNKKHSGKTGKAQPKVQELF